MANWGSLYTDIKDLLWRPELSNSLISDHLRAAHNYIHSVKPWWFLEKTQQSINVTEQRISLPADFMHPRNLLISRTGENNWNHVYLQNDVGYIRSRWADLTGYPEEYAIFADEIWLGPPPDTLGYDLEFSYVARPSLPTTTQTTLSTWLSENRPLLPTYRACSTIAAAYLQDPQMAATFGALFQSELEQLEADDQSRDRDLTALIEPDETYWMQEYL